MCVIAYAPKGVDIPTPEKIGQMWLRNPDGAGFAYEDTRTHQIVYKKGFLTLKALLEELENPERFKNTNFAIHFRIGTSGENDEHTCHPFPLSTTFGDLRKLEGEEDAVLFHNGILSQGQASNPLASDTQDFVIAFAPLLKKYSKSKTRDFFMEKVVTGSRLLILYKNNKVKMYGKWEKDGELYVSNKYYDACGYSYNYYANAYYDDWHRAWNSDDTDYAFSSASTSHQLTDEQRNDAIATIEYVIEEGYADLLKEDMRLIKALADDYDRERIYYKGYVFGYLNQMIWLESEPGNALKEERKATCA